VNGEKEESAGETPTEVVGTTGVPRKAGDDRGFEQQKWKNRLVQALTMCHNTVASAVGRIKFAFEVSCAV